MTGEITLRGRVLPIGGLKEKLLAAKNAGMKTVLVPAKNERDVEEISTEITKGLEIKFVTRSEEDKFTFHITIFPNASASVNVNSTNRQPISYYGKLSVD